MKVLAVLLAFIAAALAFEVGIATLKGTKYDSGVTGTVYFVTLNSSYVWVHAELTQITTGTNSHGLHIHQYGNKISDDGTSAGPHYVGAGTTSHGCPETNGTNRHEGDMGSWTVTGGAISQSKELDLIILTGGNSIIGKAVVLHQNPDDCVTPATGNAGNRIAYGVIGVANPALFPASVIALIPNFNASNPGPNNAVSGDTSVTKAIVILNPTTANVSLGNVSGVVTFEQTANGLVITGAFTGIPNHQQQGFGIHVHTFADTFAAGGAVNGQGAGSHFMTNSAQVHSAPPTSTRHAGDLGNICTFDANGVAYYQYTVTDGLISLNGGANSILGRNLIVHGYYDTALATTDFGPRVSQGVIGTYNVTAAFPAVLPAGITPPSDPRCLASNTTTTTTTTTTTGSSTTTTSSASIISCGVALIFVIFALLF